MLDRWVPDEQTGMYFKASAFPDSVTKWDGIQLVFANDHPDLDQFEKDPQAALEKVKGKIVGQCANTRFVQEGHPHLRTALEITDQECVDLWNKGQLSLSTAFWATVDNTDVIGDIKPNHVLLFKEDAVNQPKDKGTLIQKGTTMEPKTAVNNAGRVISQSNATELNGILSSLQAFFARMTGTIPISADPGLAGEVGVAGEADDTVTENPTKLGETAEGTKVPKVPAAPGSSKSITPAGEALPLTPMMPKQDTPYADLQPHGKEGFVNPSRNKQDENMTADTESLNQKVVAISVELAQKDVLIKEKDARIDNLTAQLEQKAADFKTAADILAEKDAAIAAAEEKAESAAEAKKEAEAKVANMVQKETDAKFDAIVKQLPAGFSNKEEDVAALKTLSTADPLAFAQKIVEMANSVKVPITKTEGKAVVAATGVANMTRRHIGQYNMLTHKWVDPAQ